MQWLANICVRRPVFATVLMLLRLRRRHRRLLPASASTGSPRSTSRSVAVVTRLPGAAPEEVETEVTDKIEEAVNTISGIDELRSRLERGRLAGASSSSTSRRTSTSPPRRCATR